MTYGQDPDEDSHENGERPSLSLGDGVSETGHSWNMSSEFDD